MAHNDRPMIHPVKFLPVILLGIALLPAGSATAALHDRGGGLIYDDVLNVTWLQDAAYQVTRGAPNVDANGHMTWQDAMDWAAGVVYHDTVRNVDWDDWRLPKMLPVNGTAFDLTYNYQGQTDNGYNIISPASELSYMYYVNLNGVPLVDTNGNVNAGGAGIADPSPFTGISGATWSQTDHPIDPAYAFVVGMGNGHQNWFDKATALSVWLVRDGDVAIAPDGDINGDGSVNAADVLLGLQLVLGLAPVTAPERLHGDVAPLVNGTPAPDGQLTIADIEVIQRKLFGLAVFP